MIKKIAIAVSLTAILIDCKASESILSKMTAGITKQTQAYDLSEYLTEGDFSASDWGKGSLALLGTVAASAIVPLAINVIPLAVKKADPKDLMATSLETLFNNIVNPFLNAQVNYLLRTAESKVIDIVKFEPDVVVS